MAGEGEVETADVSWILGLVIARFFVTFAVAKIITDEWPFDFTEE